MEKCVEKYCRKTWPKSRSGQLDDENRFLDLDDIFPSNGALNVDPNAIGNFLPPGFELPGNKLPPGIAMKKRR